MASAGSREEAAGSGLARDKPRAAEAKEGGGRRQKRRCQQNRMTRGELGKMQLKCGVKTGFDVGHGA